jgi:hypothetical protein
MANSPAITRAPERLVLIGEPTALRTAVTSADERRRNSLLAARIGNPELSGRPVAPRSASRLAQSPQQRTNGGNSPHLPTAPT